MTLTPTRPAVHAGAPPRRSVALDVARGLTVAAMILVNNQGSGAHAFWGMSHADWNGWSPADLVFPSFLFIVGASLAVSAERGRLGTGRVLRRAALLVGLGVAMNLLPFGHLDEVRVMGVLQRIGLAYLGAALLIRNTTISKQVRFVIVVLLGYWAVVSIGGHMTPALNVPGRFDRAVLGTRHLYKNGGYDPEGLLSTLPAVVTVLAGYWAVRWVRRQPEGARGVGARLAVAGGACVVAGQLWGFVLPVNKRLWTSSFVVLAAGFSLLVLAACHELIETRGRVRWARPFAVFGANALVVFIASEELGGWMARLGWRPWLYRNLFAPASFRLGSLLYGLTFVALWWLVCVALYRRRIFVKV